MQSYRPEELFDENGAFRSELADLAPKGARRMGDNPHANGGLLLKDLELPDFRDFAVEVSSPGGGHRRVHQGDGRFSRRGHAPQPGRQQFPPLRSRRDGLQPPDAMCSRSRRAPGTPRSCPTTTCLSPTGRVMEILSEQTIQGWIEGYLLTGRHGVFSCYEAFIHIIDSMFNQYAKWLDVCQRHPVETAGRLSQLPAHLARLAAGPQRLLAPGSRVHRSRAHQESSGHPGLSAARRQLSARPSPISACAAATSSTSSSPASSRNRSGSIWLRPYGTAARASASGAGRATTRTASPTW